MSKGPDGPKETALDKELASIGIERYSRYQEKFLPLEKFAISQQTGPHQQVEQQQARNYSNANYAQAYGQLTPQLGRASGAAGVGAGSGRFLAPIEHTGLDYGKASGLGAVDTNMASQRNLTNNLQNLIAIGQGKQAGALASMTSAADISNKQAIIDARSSAAANLAVMNGIGAGVGVGLGSFSQSPSGLTLGGR